MSLDGILGKPMYGENIDTMYANDELNRQYVAAFNHVSYGDFQNAFVSPAKKAHADKLAAARARFGQPFAHEPGSTWKPPRIPVLTAWAGRRA